MRSLPGMAGTSFALPCLPARKRTQTALISWIQSNLSGWNEAHPDAMPIGMSTGYADWDVHGDVNYETLINRADKKMYEVKKSQKARVTLVRQKKTRLCQAGFYYAFVSFSPMYIACSESASSSGTSRYFFAISTQQAISSGSRRSSSGSFGARMPSCPNRCIFFQRKLCHKRQNIARMRETRAR